MSRVVVTGANGFLGWHTRAALCEMGGDVRSLAVGNKFSLDDAVAVVSGASRLIHIAGVNRGTDEEVRDGNMRFANQMAHALRRSPQPPVTVVFANSTQAGNGNVYGEAKLAASDIVRAAAEAVGATFEDVRLPNLFGEHGRPFYNAVTATFCYLLARGDAPVVKDDKPLTLLHAQNAADILIGAVDEVGGKALEFEDTVYGLLLRLRGIASTYSRGEIPNIASMFDRDLFNTYRSYTFPDQAPIQLARHTDSRGSFFETIRSHGGGGQSSFSTTAPAISRGDHFHRRKVERFTVLSGTATIALRRLFTEKVYEYQVNGLEPVAIDMPTMWSHKITNVGTDPLFTSFWSNELFDHDVPDTIMETV